MKNRYRFLLSLFILLLLPLVVAAFPVDAVRAKERAAALLNRRCGRTITSEELRMDYATSTSFLFSNHSDFAMIAADDRLPEVLAYGKKGDGRMPVALQRYMEANKKKSVAADRLFCPVKPLLPFVRHQSAPYNNHCPLYKEKNGVVTRYHCLVGCVATALEEVISYYRREVVLLDTLHGWKTTQYEIDDVLPGTRVDCRLIRNNYDVDDCTTEEIDAVSRLSYYCGVAAHMRWGIASSGANIKNLVKPMQRAFGYPYVKYVDSYQYAPDDWLSMMRNELYGGRPVLYTAFNMWLMGHAFVVDGLDKDGFFHVNWGYGGSYDGYFRLDVLNFNEPIYDQTLAGSEAGFFCNHQALLLCPDPVEVELPDTLSRTGREIVVDSIIMNHQAETGKHTPLTVYFRNTTAQPLTTPFEFFTNLPSDTAVFEQADYIGLCGIYLAPYEQKKMLVHAEFGEVGERILRVSSDGEIVNFEMPVLVDKGRPSQLTFHIPELSFPEKDRVFVTLRVENAVGAGDGGQEVQYELGPGDAATMKDGVRHSRHIYVAAGTALTDTVSFRCLEPGQIYTLLVRSPWKIQTQQTFKMPALSGISPISSDYGNTTTNWYLLDGRPIKRPIEKGIYLRRNGNKTNKVYFK